MSAERRMDYALADRRLQFRIAAENRRKWARLRISSPTTRRGASSSWAGTWPRSSAIARENRRPAHHRQDATVGTRTTLRRFRRNELHCLVLSKVGNFAIGPAGRRRVDFRSRAAFGSRQEEAQRLGRILRPKSDGRAAHFFTLVSRDTREE